MYKKNKWLTANIELSICFPYLIRTTWIKSINKDWEKTVCIIFNSIYGSVHIV